MTLSPYKAIIRTMSKILLLLLIFTHNSYSSRYTMEDLKILVKNKNYLEFFNHAQDITPSLRDKNWKSYVNEMGLSYLENLNKKTILTEQHLKMVYKISTWPSLNNDEFFISKRDNIFLKEIEHCSLKSNNCDKKVQQIVNDFQHAPDFPFKIIQVLYKKNRLNPNIDLILNSFIQEDISEFYCAKEPLSELLINKLIASPELLKNNSIHSDCLKSLLPKIKIELMTLDARKRKAIQKILKQAKALTNKDNIKLDLLDILQDVYSQLDIDSILKNLKELKDSPAIREEFLGILKESHEFPDRLFETKDKKKIALIRIINRNFPELIDTYVHTCLNYLEGTKKYPKGNPTVKCHQFMETNKQIQILPQSLVNRYKKSTKFLR